MNTWDLFSEGNEKPTPHEKFKRGIKSAGYDMDAGAKRLEDLLAKQKAERDAREKEEQKNVSEAQDEVDYDDDYQDMVRRVGEKAKAADALKAQGKQPQTKFNPKTGRYYVDHGQDKPVKENAEKLNIGDPVIVTGNVEFEGTTGDIIAFGQDKRFVVVNLYNHGKHSFHSSDVSFNDYADSDDEEARMQEAGYGRNRGYTPGIPSPHAPTLGGRGRREDDEYHVPDPVAPTWYIRANGKIIKDKMGTPYQYRDKEVARKAAMTMMSKPFNAGKKFTLTTNPQDDRPENEAVLHTKYKRNRFSGVQQRDQAQDELSNIAMNRVKGMAEGSQRVDSLVTDALRIMKGPEASDAVAALKTVLGDREYNGRRGHYNFYVKQILDMYGQQGMAEGLGLYGPFTVTINTGERPQSRTKTKKFRREDDAILWAQDWLEDAPQYVFATAQVTDPNGNVVWTTDEQGVAEGKKPDNYHIVNKDGKPASLASYADRASAEKDRDAKHPGAEVRQVGPRGKVKGVSEERTETKNEKGEVTSWRDESDWRKVSKEKGGRGRVTNLSDKARRETEKLKKEKNVDEGWKSALGGAALAGAMALGGNTAHAQPSGEDFLPDIVAHVTFKVNGNTVTKDINLGTAFKSPGEASAALEKFLKAKGIKYFDYSLERVKSKDDNYLEKTPAVDTGYSGSIDSGPYRATGGNNDYMAKESIEEAVDRAAKSMMEDGYEFTEAANPAQQAAIAISMKKAGKKPKTEEKVRLDPKCWTGKKIGNPKTKMKGGVRVNNCVPK